MRFLFLIAVIISINCDNLGMYVNKVMILGHSFVRRLQNDLSNNFDIRAASDFNINSCSVRLFGNRGRTVQKIRQFDFQNVVRFGPDVIILEVGTNDLKNHRPETVGSDIDELIKQLREKTSARVIGVCN